MFFYYNLFRSYGKGGWQGADLQNVKILTQQSFYPGISPFLYRMLPKVITLKRAQNKDNQIFTENNVSSEQKNYRSPEILHELAPSARDIWHVLQGMDFEI